MYLHYNYTWTIHVPLYMYLHDVHDMAANCQSRHTCVTIIEHSFQMSSNSRFKIQDWIHLSTHSNQSPLVKDFKGT